MRHPLRDFLDEFGEELASGEEDSSEVQIEKVDAGLPLFIIRDNQQSQIKRDAKKAALQRDSNTVWDIARFNTLDIFARNTEMSIIEYKDTRCKLVDTGKTVVINATKGKELVAGIQYEDECYCYDDEDKRYPLKLLFAVDEETYALFDDYEEVVDKHKAIITYSRLSESQRDFVKSQFARPEQGNIKEEIGYTPIRNEEALRLLFKTCEKTYSPAIRTKAKLLFAELDAGTSSSDKYDIVSQLSHILCIDTQLHPHKPKSYEEIMECFDKRVYGMTELKERITEYIIAMQYSGAANFEILLVGPPGVGKTSIGEVVAECYDNPFIHIDCAGANSISMGGLVKSYGGARAGKVVQSLYAKGRSDVTMMFDEIDKLTVNKDGDPYSVLIKAIGPQKALYDEYVDQDIDISSTKIICTANDPSLLPPYILNRFGDNVFYIDAYSAEEKVAIAEKYVVRKKLDKYKISEDELIFEKEALDLIAEKYCEDEGAREISSYIESLIRKVIVLWTRGMVEKPFKIDADFVRNNLKKMSTTSKKETERKIGFGA